MTETHKDSFTFTLGKDNQALKDYLDLLFNQGKALGLGKAQVLRLLVASMASSFPEGLPVLGNVNVSSVQKTTDEVSESDNTEQQPTQDVLDSKEEDNDSEQQLTDLEHERAVQLGILSPDD